jgi:membrane protein
MTTDDSEGAPPAMTGNSNNLADKVQAVYRRANGLTGGVLDVLADAARRFDEVHAAQATASFAYYAVFSLFPLLLGFIAAGSFVLERDQVQQRVLDFAADVFPIAQPLIERNVQRVLELRGTVGTLATVGLLWSATGALTVLAYNINRAWPEAKPRNFVKRRLVALGMVVGLAGLLALSSIAGAVFDVLARLSVPLWGGLAIYETPLRAILSSVAPGLLAFLALLGLYRWVPNTTVRWWEAFWGALVATLAGGIATNGFTWYLSSGIAQYELVYGSVGAIVALMLWIYIGGLITLFGAHLSAAIARHAEPGGQRP